MKYFVKTPWWLKKIYPQRIWHIDTKEKNIYLTFDDGPHPTATAFVLDLLKENNAEATFFCLGKNVESHPDLYQRIIHEGHSVGNHTFNHLNGWKVEDKAYLNDITSARNFIDSSLFRPPYGRMTSFQAKQFHKAIRDKDASIIMWDVLSGDFDNTIDEKKCAENVILNAKEGSVVVFHDSEKCFQKLKHSLPLVLKHFINEGYQFKKL